ncbi:MAG: phenylalanine--tRNA ligase subunit alpha [Sphingobacteriales bacterium]|nr:phenylalanine--tRNA ligase subunit alpha [Sphingobacteriales bacterium]
MKEQIEKHTEEIKNFVAKNAEELEQFRLKFLSRKGIVNDLFEAFKAMPPEEKKVFGKVMNEFKTIAENAFNSFKEKLEETEVSTSQDIDYTLPGEAYSTGSRHPVSLVLKEISDIFQRMGFTIANGPEIEDDWHNFSSLNFPMEHPARDMQDTFFVRKDPNKPEDDLALRTHTSSVQIRLMENNKPPFRAIMPGRVFRNEAISARSHCIFHQVEGLYVDKDVSFADLKQTLYYFVQELFGVGTEVRFRPSYFPFTEPSAEMDIQCKNCGGKGCNICKYSGWVEILGCGMVDPNVLQNCGIDPNEYSGFAFGVGIERLAMNKFKIKDIRMFFENDIRLLSQFNSELI